MSNVKCFLFQSCHHANENIYNKPAIPCNPNSKFIRHTLSIQQLVRIPFVALLPATWNVFASVALWKPVLATVRVLAVTTGAYNFGHTIKALVYETFARFLLLLWWVLPGFQSFNFIYILVVHVFFGSRYQTITFVGCSLLWEKK